MEPVTLDALHAFLQLLGERFTGTATIYLLGGGALALLGNPRTTVDVDYTFEAEPGLEEQFEATVADLAAEMRLDVESVPIGEFVPLPPQAYARRWFVGRYGALTVYIFDPYTIALSKIARGFEADLLMPLEQFYKDSIATGIRVGEDLRGQVRQAIETLGNGFLHGGAQGLEPLHTRLQEDEDLCQRYYGEILHVIYRTLFLLFAEQRGMMVGRDSLYAESYSIARLRARAEGDIPREDGFTDLSGGLKVTFRMVREGVPALGVFGYDGMLFEDDAATMLQCTGQASTMPRNGRVYCRMISPP
jgi:hypothetical protein